MDNKKYKFTGETMQFEGHILRRIIYLRETPYTKRGILGGWIESEHNLSHEGRCAVLHEAKVLGNARIEEDALAFQQSIIKDNAKIKGTTEIFGKSIIGADSILADATRVCDEATVHFYSTLENTTSHVTGSTLIGGKAKIEATGTICNCDIGSVEFTGHLNLKNATYSKR